MESITSELKEELQRLGADIVGIGDITLLPAEERKNMTFGIAVAVAIDRETVRGIENGPTVEYHDAYHRLNNKLDEIVTLGAQYLQRNGYDAIAQTIAEVEKTEKEYSSVLPHKTVATRAGIGWIGKNAMLVTKDYGSAVRISVILTNAPLQADQPVNDSKCKDCLCCKEACPGEAISGLNWNIDTYRDLFYDPVKCKSAARRITKERLHIEKTLCSKCVLVCPFTQVYLNRSDREQSLSGD